jgi:hypothetical protein
MGKMEAHLEIAVMRRAGDSAPYHGIAPAGVYV